MTLDITTLSIYKDYGGKDQVVVGNGQGIKITRIGCSTISFGDKHFVLSYILLLPKLKSQLLSAQRFFRERE